MKIVLLLHILQTFYFLFGIRVDTSLSGCGGMTQCTFIRGSRVTNKQKIACILMCLKLMTLIFLVKFHISRDVKGWWFGTFTRGGYFFEVNQGIVVLLFPNSEYLLIIFFSMIYNSTTSWSYCIMFILIIPLHRRCEQIQIDLRRYSLIRFINK